MQTVKVKKDELLEALRKNRSEHRAVFEKALSGFRRAAVERMDEMLKCASAGKRIDQHVGLIEPMDQTREYDRAIRKLEMSVDEEIVLSDAEFRCFVMDDWNWKEQFTTSTMGYV